MLSQDQVREMFLQCGALLEGHFELTSGRHSNQYLEKFSVLQHPEPTCRLCAEWAERFREESINVVVGPATGGIILAFETARILGCRALFTEREAGTMQLRRGFRIHPGERILVVEDVVTTGGSVREVLDLLDRTEGKVVGVGLICDRSEEGVDFGVRTEALLRLPLAAWEPEDCPLCVSGVELRTRGSRHL